MPIVWIHGSLSSRLMWRRMQERFGGTAIDLPGALGRPPVDPETWTVDDDLQAITDAVGPEPIWLVGHSYGGLLALRWAHEHPDRVAGIVAHEPVLWPLLLGRPPDLGRLGLGDDTPAFLDPTEGGSEPWLRRFVDFWNGAGAWERLPAMVRRASVTAGPKTWLEVHHACHEPTPDEAWRQLRVPVRLTVGEGSPAPEHQVVERLAMRLPDVQVVSTPGGHTAPLTHPDDVAAIWSRWL